MNAAWSADFIEARCSIFDRNGSLIKNFTGFLCGFMDDGSRISIDNTSMEYIDSNEKVIWKAYGLFHHDFKIDQNKKDVLVMDETAHDVLGCRTRFDTVKRFDIKTGKLLHTTDMYDHFKDGSIKLNRGISILNRGSFRKAEGRYTCSTTHANSIFQIEENDIEAKYPEFKKGNWLFHLGWTGQILIFDNEFKKLVGQRFIDIEDYRFHDIQLTKEGKLLLYVNNMEQKGKPVETSLALVDVTRGGKGSIEILPLRVDGKPFHQERVGGVQFLPDGEKLVSIYTEGEGFQGAFFNKKWDVIKKIKFHQSGFSKKGQDFQSAKVLDLSKFLKNYTGP